jgi:membrane-associated phospholipid phosphatase
MNWKSALVRNWSAFASSKKNLSLLVLSFVLMVAMLHFTASFITSIENRQGFSFPDPILSLFQPIDLTWLIFLFLYLSVLLSFFLLLKNPTELLLAFFAYSFLLFLRIFCMYLLPLDPPKDIILLKDPIIEYFGTDKTLTRDLFFSGHTSLMVLLFLLVRNKYARPVLLLSVFVVGIGVMLQKVHYSVDVVVAVFAAYCSYSWTKKLLSRFNLYP